MFFCNVRYRDAVARCGECSSVDGCGFCESSLQCLSGTMAGPTGATLCASWVYVNTTCQGNRVGTVSKPTCCNLLTIYSSCLFTATPNCRKYTDCNNCASQEQCAWCASENLCTTIEDSFQRNCRGLVFEPPCPTDFVSGECYLCFFPTLVGSAVNAL
jgi:hypothetical protein